MQLFFKVRKLLFYDSSNNFMRIKIRVSTSKLELRTIFIIDNAKIHRTDKII